MKLSKIYSSQPTLFIPIYLNHGLRHESGLNVVFAEITKHKDTKKDNHNLGKTILIQLIDFLLLKEISNKNKFFLTKHLDRFSQFEFYLEVLISENEFVTIKRAPLKNTKISFKRHNSAYEDFTNLHENDWDHIDMPIRKAKELLDSYLNLTIIKPWPYRSGVTYFLRSQNDYRDFFQIEKYSRGKDKDWKPYMANLFGYNFKNLIGKYDLDKEIENLTELKKEKESEVQKEHQEYSKLKNKIKINKKDIDAKIKKIDNFSFKAAEKKINKYLVSDLEIRISQVNKDIYNLSYDIEKIQSSLKETTSFSLNKIQQIFKESTLYFPDQLKRKYEDLVEFNKKISTDRRKALKKQLKIFQVQKEDAGQKKEVLDTERVKYLSILKEADTFSKFKKLQKEVISKEAEISLWEGQLKRLKEARDLTKQIRSIEKKRDKLIEKLSDYPERTTPIFEDIQAEFHKLVKRVLNLSGNLYIRQNSNDNIDFIIDIDKPGDHGEITSQSEGTTYKKLLCALYDLAILKAFSKSHFFHFVYHDGIFEGLDNRKRQILLDVIREYSCKHQIQHIITTIDTDLPRNENDKKMYFAEDEIILTLSDKGKKGRLFRMDEF